MNWFNNLALTYDNVPEIVGIPDEKGNVLLPSNHMTKKTDIIVIIDSEGEFRHAEYSDAVIVIPCTEKSSSSRSGKAISPHPLHEELGYICYDEKKREAYFKQLAAWHDRHPKVCAVYNYLKRETLLNDLRKSGITVDKDKLNTFKKNGEKKSEKELQDEIYKQFVRFSVEIPGDLKPCLWKDDTVTVAWQNYQAELDEGVIELCYVLGKVCPTVLKHPGGINPYTNGAKLISSNDSTNYSFRGRFSVPEQANVISAEASGKAHAMLKYLIATQGYKCGTQAIVAWAVDTGEAALNPFASSDEFFGDDESVKTDSDKLIGSQDVLATDYAKRLRNAYCGVGNAGKLRKTTRQIAVIVVDAVTKNSGRMSVTYYQDIHENEYIERVVLWHEQCCWWFRKDKREYKSAPSVDRIIEAVYGEPKGEGYEKIKKQTRERLLHDIICGEHIDSGWVKAAVNRVSNPFSYSKEDGGWDKSTWETAISVTCAITRKYFFNKKEDFSLELENECRDRSYLYGRLLAIAEKIESHARYLQTGKDNSDKRPVNAIRYMTIFTAKPFRTWALIYSQINPYIQRLDGADWYQRQIDEIMSKFESGDYESDKPLDGKYLLGYSLQRKCLYNTNNKEE
ncbi:MAG: type I-C CRISPR-associated protein Cas8c/Csd1 [Oscillospiraceae bacterium]|nr:type I-C CRISPR-associated protein Cas8c/Csd1 [Oscillospiraceae bacterium]